MPGSSARASARWPRPRPRLAARRFASAARCVDARGRALTALGSVAPRPLRVPAAEALIAERGLSEATAEQAGRLVMEAMTPISDHRAGADYRRAIAGPMVARMLSELAR